MLIVFIKSKYCQNKIEIPQGYTLVTYGLHILNVPVGFQDFATHVLNEALFQDMVYINDLPFLGDTQVTYKNNLSHKNNTSFFFLFVSFGEFRQENYTSLWGHYGSRIVGVFFKAP
jgi:hypothetical protein